MAEKISTEEFVYGIGQVGTPEANRCCTKARAEEMGCYVHGEREDNQLVTEVDTYSEPIIKYEIRVMCDFENVNGYFYLSVGDNFSDSKTIKAIDLSTLKKGDVFSGSENVVISGEADMRYVTDGTVTLVMYCETGDIGRYEWEWKGYTDVSGSTGTNYTTNTTTPVYITGYPDSTISINLGEY